MPEIERLSLQWDSQDSQLKSKVFDLSKLEERLHKAMIEVCLNVSRSTSQSSKRETESKIR